MNDKATTVLDARLLKLVERICRFVDFRQRILPVVRKFIRIVRFVPRFLQINERVSEILDSVWKFFHCLLIQAGTFCVSVFKRAVYPMPSRIMCSANEKVSGGVSQRVEHRIIRRANRSAQISLRGPSPIKPR